MSATCTSAVQARTDSRSNCVEYESGLPHLRARARSCVRPGTGRAGGLERDELDPHCHHVIARDAHGQPIGTGRLTPERKIGRMAVLPDWRGRGVGDALLLALIEQARATGLA